MRKTLSNIKETLQYTGIICLSLLSALWLFVQKRKTKWHYIPNRNFVNLYFLNILKHNIGPITPTVITTMASAKKIYHKSVSNGNFLNTAFIKPSNVVWNKYLRLVSPSRIEYIGKQQTIRIWLRLFHLEILDEGMRPDMFKRNYPKSTSIFLNCSIQNKSVSGNDV